MAENGEKNMGKQWASYEYGNTHEQMILTLKSKVKTMKQPNSTG